MREQSSLLIKKISRCLCIALCFFVSISEASTYQSHNSIYKAVKDYIKVHVLSKNKSATVNVGKLDSRLKLKRCSKKLLAFLPKGSRTSGKTTVGVKCSGSKPWSLHVPATISVYGNVLVASRQLQKGSVLTRTDFEVKKYDLANLPHGFIDDVKQSSGMKLKRRIMAGTVLTPAMLKKPRIISRGQRITILAQTGRMQVRMEGKALAHGAAGERIKVMNLKSKQKLEGVITLAGEVKIDI